MKKLALPFIAVLFIPLQLACSGEKSPEEIEAAKYPKVQPLSAEKQKELRQKAGMDTPIGARGAPPSSQPPKAGS